jgi:hypothetical protein
MSVSVEAVERTMQVLAERSPLPFTYRDPASGDPVEVPPETLASASGFLPAIVSAGEAVWQEVTGKGFELDLTRDNEALLGYRLRSIGAGSFATVMLSAMEAMQQVAGPEAVVVSDLRTVSEAAGARIRQAEPIAPVAPSQSARP